VIDSSELPRLNAIFQEPLGKLAEVVAQKRRRETTTTGFTNDAIAFLRNNQYRTSATISMTFAAV
jgi:hypothetical protein